MALPITIPNTFATESTNIPLSDLDANFTTVANAVNGIGSGSEALANVAITGGTITNVTANTISISNVAVTGGTITGITDLAVADGGTGASTAANARTNLGAAASGANSDITSLSGLTTPLSVAQGGTGAATAANARTSLGLGTLATQNSVTAAQLPSGSVVQTRYAQYTSTTVVSGGTWTDTGITVDITPSATSNKILVRACIAWSATDSTPMLFRLARNGTVIGSGSSSAILALGQDSFVRSSIFVATFEYQDSPSSTSALTYKVQGYTPSGGWTINENQYSSGGLEGYYSTSSITVQEIVG